MLASLAATCYQAAMTDSNDANGGGDEHGRPTSRRGPDERLPPRDGDKPSRAPWSTSRAETPGGGELRDASALLSDPGDRATTEPNRGKDRPRRKDGAQPQPPARERAPHAAPPPGTSEPAEERIAKVIARAGIASRRDAEAMIAEGRVTLNGEPVTSPALNVAPDAAIAVDGEPLPARERTRLWIFHKPRGLVTTARDPQGRPTVFEHLPPDLPRVVAIGRLDINTEGLLLLTNDGGLARVIAHPDTGWLRRYKVRAHGDVAQGELDRLKEGITLDGMDYGPVEAALDRVQGDNSWITLGLREGKNREIKRILEHLGLQVNRLIRLSFGPFQLGDLEPGLVEEVRTKVLKEQLGTKLAAEAGVDFESKVREPIAPFGGPDKREGTPAGGEGSRPPRRRHEDGPDRRRADGDRRAPSRRDEAPRPPRGGFRPSVWRDEGGEGAPRSGVKAPRRGADPRQARAAAAERPRERLGSVTAGVGRNVVVERLVSAPRADARSNAGPRPDARKPRREAPRGDDRPRRPRDERDRSDRRFDGRDEGHSRAERRGPRDDSVPGGRAFRRPRDDGPPDRGAWGNDGRPARGFGKRPGRDDRGGEGRPPRGARPGPSRGRGGEDRPRRGPPGEGRPPRGPKSPPRGRR
jgi:23S rRNA pseudouridine2605 synthase